MAIKKVGYRLSYIGLSTDTKPIDVPAGSIFRELDTKLLFMFDGVETWYQI